MLDPDPEEADSAAAGRRVRLRLGLGAAVVLVLAAFAVAVVIGLLTPGGTTAVITASDHAHSSTASGAASPAASASASDAATIYVQLVGAVVHPGLYRLAPGARLVDAVAAAGGFAADADPASVNLARPLVDGEQIVVGTPGAPPPASVGSTPAAGAKVDLNTADAAALETLPRIGPAMAQRILDWRTKNGRFRSVEDLLDVTGIGDATFAGLKDLVTV